MKTNVPLIGTLQSIPIAALSLSPHNVRKTGGKSIEDLAASIHAQGLIHNLTVTPINGSGKYHVIAGGRRWRALRHLIKAKVAEAVREAVGTDAAAAIEKMKKNAAADAAAQVVDGKGWLPSLLRPKV